MTVSNPLPSPNNDVIVRSTIPVYILAHAKTGTDLQARKCVQSAADGDTDDLLEIIQGASESQRITGWVLFNEANKATLGSVNAQVTKTTVYVSGDHVWIGMRIPVIEAILTTAAGAALYPGQRYVCAGAGMLKTHPASLVTAVTTATTTYYLNAASLGVPLDPTVCIGLSYVTTADSTQFIQVMPLW